MQISLRELQISDAPLMLEWMHDPEIQKSFTKDMLNTTLKQAETFCEDSCIPKEIITGTSLHFAIVDESNEYLGTISLKDIDVENGNAEYAITTRAKAHGRGVAFKATGELLRKAFKEYGLHRVYLNVFDDNIAAIKLYEKCGFVFEGEFRDHFKIGDGYRNWKWYRMLESEYDETLFER